MLIEFEFCLRKKLALFFSFLFFFQDLLSNLSGLLCGWKESVEVKRQSVEFLIAIVASECSELHPPWHASVFLRLFHFQCVVKKHSHNQSHCWWRGEYRVDECIELQSLCKVLEVRRKYEIDIACCTRFWWFRKNSPIQHWYEQDHGDLGTNIHWRIEELRFLGRVKGLWWRDYAYSSCLWTGEMTSQQNLQKEWDLKRWQKCV